MPKLSLYPIPKKRYHGSRWRIYWKYNGRQYTISTDFFFENKIAGLDAEMRKISAALAEDSPAFPEKYASQPGVVKYLADRYGAPATEPETQTETPDGDAVMEEYRENLTLHCANSWAINSHSMVRKFRSFVDGDILMATPKQAMTFLESILKKKRPPTSRRKRPPIATRNRNLAACSRFYNWCLSNGYATSNPFASIKTMKEPDAEEIVYCTKAERERIINAARGLARPDWIAIPIALYAGCRREEVFCLNWTDVVFDTRKLVVRKSKTGRKRTAPIAKELLAILEAIPDKHGLVVPRSEGETWENQADRLVELVREHLSRPENPNLKGHAGESIGKRRFLMAESALAAQGTCLAAAQEDMKKGDMKGKDLLLQAIKVAGMQICPARARDGGAWIPAERIGWNAFRHTFASLRVQAGVTLDKVCSWMGNTRAVCEKHYAQFVPRDAVDDDIDKGTSQNHHVSVH